MARGASVKKTEFEFVKELLAKGEKAIDISEKLKRSPETIRTIDYAKDFDDFCSTPSKELRKRRKMRKAEQMQINVDTVCELESVNAKDEFVDENRPIFELVQGAQLSAADKTELAKYIIDQHYFFLKQLTGVI